MKGPMEENPIFDRAQNPNPDPIQQQIGTAPESKEQEISPAPSASDKDLPASAPICRSTHLRTRSPSPTKLLLKLADVMSDLNWVEKRGYNAHFDYYYATESDILAAVRPRLAEKKIFVQTIVEKDETVSRGAKDKNGQDILLRYVQVLAIIHDAESGETMDVIGIGYAQEGSDDKAYYKAFTGAMKYLFSKLFLISTGDDPENMTQEEKDASAKNKKEKRPAPNGGQGPQRTGGGNMPAEGATFTIDGPVGEFERARTKDGKPRFIFKLGLAGNASTIDSKLAEMLIKEKPSGKRFRWSLIRSGSFVNLKGVVLAPPEGEEG